MAKMGRPATGQGVNKYIPVAALGIIGVLVFLAKRGDKDSLEELEALARKRATELGYTESHTSN